MNEPRLSVVERGLSGLAAAIHARPALFFFPQIVLLALSVAYTVAELEINTSRNDLVDANKRYHQNFLRYREEFSAPDDLVAVVESGDMMKNRQFVERLAGKLQANEQTFTNVMWLNDLKMLGPKALLFLPETNLVDIRDILIEYRPVMEKFTRATNLATLFQQVNTQFREAGKTQGEDSNVDSLIEALPALERIVREAHDSMLRPGTPPSPGITAMFDAEGEAEKKQYITFSDGRTYLVTAHPISRDLENHAVREMRRLISETKAEVPGVNVGLTGETVLEYDEMKQAEEDTAFAAAFALAIVALIFIYSYNGTGRPLKATVCLMVGLGYTMGFTTLTIGHLNILTITFAPIQIGLAIDFGVHLITRYEEELRRGSTELEALRTAMVHTGSGILTSGLTTAGAFLAMGMTGFKGVREMGIISGGGLLLSLIPMMVMLPVLLLWGKKQNALDRRRAAGRSQSDAAPPSGGAKRRERIERLWLTRPRTVVCTGVALTGLALAQAGKVSFDYNLLHLQTEGLAAVEYAGKLMNDSSRSLLYGAMVADDLEESVAYKKKVEKLSTVKEALTMGEFLTEDPSRKLELMKEIKTILEPVRFPPMDIEEVEISKLSRILWSTMGFLGTAIERIEADGEQAALLDKLKPLHETLAEMRVELNREAVAGRNAARLTAFQQALFVDMKQTLGALRNQDASGGLTEADLPVTFRNRFVGTTGKHLIQVFPRESVWGREFQEKFVSELRTVDPDVTGTPVQLLEYTTLLKQSFVEAAYYALGAIVILVFIHFHRISCVFLALIPVTLGGIWAVGLMGILNIPFNPANIMTLPLVIGIGVTSGIHILNRFGEEDHPSIFAKSTGKAVLVSALTTMAGFGSLMLAKHQGIESLGYVMSIGVATCMVAALTFLTAVLTLLSRMGWSIKKPSGVA